MILAALQSTGVENLPGGQDSLLTFFRETGPAAKVVLGILLFFSVVSWIIIFAKFIRLRRVARQSEKFVAFFRKSKRFSEVNAIASQLGETPLTTLFKAGYAELDAQVKANRPEDPAVTASGAPSGKLVIKNISGVERALERAIGVELSRLTRYMTFLATTASACPFIGLFGTVFGIMQSFRAIGQTGSTSIAAVAPGISEALVNTAAGLAAAIPALIFYNYFMGKVRQQRAGMDDFALEFINLAERNFT
ncbi:MAG TPA: MotA/TolQ/ExbB proton channel family protein [Thermoanaerobaculia bacterium]|jgi:biopolymer transport protein TolQ|nr:MotA/TolQ/ExbB proton channel family protein [Thermoanaerobaculia bacterium]